MDRVAQKLVLTSQQPHSIAAWFSGSNNNTVAALMCEVGKKKLAPLEASLLKGSVVTDPRKVCSCYVIFS